MSVPFGKYWRNNLLNEKPQLSPTVLRSPPETTAVMGGSGMASIVVAIRPMSTLCGQFLPRDEERSQWDHDEENHTDRPDDRFQTADPMSIQLGDRLTVR